MAGRGEAPGGIREVRPVSTDPTIIGLDKSPLARGTDRTRAAIAGAEYEDAREAHERSKAEARARGAAER